MKRLLPYVIVALAFHAIILSTDLRLSMFAPDPTPAAKSLAITLATHKLQSRKAHAAVSARAPKRQYPASYDQAPAENPAVMPTPAAVEQSVQPQKPLPAEAPKHVVKEIRSKKSLKALTLKKQRIQSIETAPAPDIKRHVPFKPEIKIFGKASSDRKPVHQTLPADASSIKKTPHAPAGSSEPTTSTAMLSDDTSSGQVFKLARPMYKQNTAPPYPRKARRLGYEGIVMLKVLIDENGRVDDLAVLKSSGYKVLDRAAVSAVKKWLFEPGTEDGIKKKMWVKIPVRFDLK